MFLAVNPLLLVILAEIQVYFAFLTRQVETLPQHINYESRTPSRCSSFDSAGTREGVTALLGASPKHLDGVDRVTGDKDWVFIPGQQGAGVTLRRLFTEDRKDDCNCVRVVAMLRSAPGTEPLARA